MSYNFAGEPEGIALLQLVTASILASGFACAQVQVCDPHLVQPPANVYGYRLRGERCEGLYVEEVAGEPLAIVSLTAFFPDFNISAGRPLPIRWVAPSSEISVRLRAQGLRRRLYYRMDAVRSGGTKLFAWPSDVVSALHLTRNDLGIVATMRMPVAGMMRDIYLPVSLSIEDGPAPRSSAAASYQLVILPGVELKEVFLSLARSGEKQSKPLVQNRPLGYGYYPAERAFTMPITGMPERGIYHLELGATLLQGGAATTELWLYHVGN